MSRNTVLLPVDQVRQLLAMSASGTQRTLLTELKVRCERNTDILVQSMASDYSEIID